MSKSPLNPESLHVESFDATPMVSHLAVAGFGTACFETCKTDPTSDPDAETCGGTDATNP